MRILVLGVSGMLGSAVFRVFSEDRKYVVFGTARNSAVKDYFDVGCQNQIICGLDILDQDSLVGVIADIKPDVVINCIGLVKQLAVVNNPLISLPINSMLPHRLSSLCRITGARLVHISTDCIFSGDKGGYVEDDVSDATDLYGKSKFIGEVRNDPNTITLRTSIIGHELHGNNSLVDWFLSKTGAVKGYSKAIFSGLPTVELARVIKDLVIPQVELSGLFHVSVDPIDKLSLLKLVADVYDKQIEIISDSQVSIDRSLDSTRFRVATGYRPPSWSDLIRSMYENR